MDLSDPYKRVKLKRNPFAQEAMFSVPEYLFLDRSFPKQPKPVQKYFVQLVGEKGSGKTTLLRRWQERIPGPYVHLPPGISRFRPLPVAPIVYWDEADRSAAILFLLALGIAARKKYTVVVGTHRDLTSLPRKLGFRIVSYTFPPLTAKELIFWANRKIQQASLILEGSLLLSISLSEAEAICRIAKGSWRVAADHLHIWVAQKVSRALAAREKKRLSEEEPSFQWS